jgi:hypothetical protein
MRKLLILIVMFLSISCTQKEFVISIEQPHENKLDGLKVEINLDNNKAKEFHLKSTNVARSYETTHFLISDEGKHDLTVKLKDSVYKYQIYYPAEKYIIIGPYLKKNGKIRLGVLKQKQKFIFH